MNAPTSDTMWQWIADNPLYCIIIGCIVVAIIASRVLK